ncbi:DNA-nicking endonuclease, Smr domain [Xaviernesmea oryzae]|uniref:DNA-nicking endonuclease, Smr domain n=1 Tax=Xaviernesmea oryzae TaxID=464029 RepID=A0A1X7EI23_9HYPH|nr:Smr/MutS family protein [Xaviernesmea oryzae]SMF34321.1 DNA-nicking endonuclease, Smr domain [Xaviernesmea oryzae]
MKSGRKLDPEERILWGKVAKSTRALPGRMKEILEFEEEEAAKLAAEEAAKPKPAPAPESQPAEIAAPKARKPGGFHHPLEKPVKKKLAKGRLPIEARLDLHGLFQSEAHDLLLDFLFRAHERGLRHVLVITGKGSSMGSEGALRRAVPLWFSKAEFRFLISSYEWAARHHGGEGAMYVRLARSPRDNRGGRAREDWGREEWE